MNDCATPYPESGASLARTLGNHGLAQTASIKIMIPTENSSSTRALMQRGLVGEEKLARETIYTVEERQGLPSEEAQKSHMAHQAFQLPSSDTSALKKKKRSPLQMRPNRSMQNP